MGKPKCDPPTPNFPHKISKRLNIMSKATPLFTCSDEGMPAYSVTGVSRFLLTKRAYKYMFTEDRVEKIDRMIELANATCYSKMAGCVLDLKTKDKKDSKKKKGWSETDWKKHMDYISTIADPKKDFTVEIPRYGESCKLELLLPRLRVLSMMPEFKVYRRPSKEDNYRDPTKVSPNALKYIITENVRKLAKPKIIRTGD